MSRAILWASLLMLAIAAGGCKKDEPVTEESTVTETQTEGVEVKVGQGGASVKVKTAEGTVDVKAGEKGTEVKANTAEGSANVKAGETGSTVKVKTTEGATKVNVDEEGAAVKVKAPGQEGVTIKRDKGRMKINVGGLKVDVPDDNDGE